MQSHPYPNRRFWQWVYAVVIVALSASVYAVSQRVDYDWRSGRVAWYFVTSQWDSGSAWHSGAA
jgi:hypothetical protein